MKILEKARCLRELAEEHGLHGLYFQHVSLCRRRAWLHLMGATHAVHHARVQRGLALHQTEKRSVSFLHAPGTGRRSLSIDMAETFRPVLSDALILSVFRRGHVDDSWWQRTPGVCLLSEKGRIKTTERFWSRIEERSGAETLRQAIYRQCMSLEREALGIGRFKPFVWRG